MPFWLFVRQVFLVLCWLGIALSGMINFGTCSRSFTNVSFYCQKVGLSVALLSFQCSGGFSFLKYGILALLGAQKWKTADLGYGTADVSFSDPAT